MKHLLLISLILLLLAACANSPSEAAETVSNITSYRSEALGVGFEYPTEWALEDSQGELQLASSGEILEGELYNDGVRVSIFAAPGEAFDNDLINSLNQLIGFMSEDEDVTVAGEPELVMINGQEGATLKLSALENEVPVFLNAAIVRNEGQVAVVLSLYDQAAAEAHEQTIDALVNSMMVFAPSE